MKLQFPFKVVLLVRSPIKRLVGASQKWKIPKIIARINNTKKILRNLCISEEQRYFLLMKKEMLQMRKHIVLMDMIMHDYQQKFLKEKEK